MTESAGAQLVESLGPRTFRSPLHLACAENGGAPGFTADDARVLREIEVPPLAGAQSLPRLFERAGPRELLYFDPRRIKVGIVTAGGLCPGINDVIRALVLELRYAYGVERIVGFRFGLPGLAVTGRAPMALDPDVVRDVHSRGGTFLGTARGTTDASSLVAGLVANEVDLLFAIGGDGTMRAAHALHRELVLQGMKIGVVGIPKTIDNDIPFVDKTFGFDTAVATARLAIEAAHAEARSVENGIGLVKLMGRNAGFIAAQATLASHVVNACLVPEVPFSLEGDGGVLAWMERRLAARGHAVVVIGEGCAAGLIEALDDRDPSGNVRFAADDQDVGRYLKRAIERHFRDRGIPIALKYVDPSYTLRATRATAEDAVFCGALARNAVHAGLAGKTDMMIGRWHRCFTHVALADVLAHEKRVDPGGELWRDVTSSTGQPALG